MIRFFLLKQQQVAAGFGLFGGGHISSYVITNLIQKYSYSNDSISSFSQNLTSNRALHAAVGNLSVGIFGGGITGSIYSLTNTTDKSVYVNETVIAGSNLTLTFKNVTGAFGNLIFGIFTSGQDQAGDRVEGSSKYTYATDITSVGTTLFSSYYTMQTLGASTSSPTFGLYALGFGYNSLVLTSRKYIFSNESAIDGSAFSKKRDELAATGNSSIGIFAGGDDSWVPVSQLEKYVYSSNAVSYGTSLSVARRGYAATGNSSIGIFSAGNGPGYYDLLLTTEKYNFSSDTISAGTSLSSGRYQPAACSSTPGHL
jgi:hypothetical protein